MTFSSDADEVFHHLHALDQKSDIFNHLPMAACVVRADGVVVWYNARAAELWGRKPAIGDTGERFCGAHTLYRADGSHMAHCDTPVALALNTGRLTVLDAGQYGNTSRSILSTVQVDANRGPRCLTGSIGCTDQCARSFLRRFRKSGANGVLDL